LEPHNANFLIGRATLYLVTKQFDTALNDLDAAIDIDPNNVGAISTVPSDRRRKDRELHRPRFACMRLKASSILQLLICVKRPS